MAKNKKLDELLDGEAEEQDEVLNPPAAAPKFEYNATAYLPVWNETFSRYDMLLIRVNTATEECRIEREATKYDSEIRAQHDLVSRVNKDFMTNKGKK